LLSEAAAVVNNDDNGFSLNAPLYASSTAHSETDDLEQVLPLLGELEDQEVLDVATGTGHTAFFFAERLAHVFAVDINDEMLAVAQEVAAARSYSCRFLKGSASALPFDEESFDLVTSRLAAHHFRSPSDFLAEAHRVLRPGGRLLLIDNIVPEGESGDWINDYERQRDSSHQLCSTRARWEQYLLGAGFARPELQEFPRVLDFDQWMKRMSLEGSEADALWQKLLQAPEEVREFLQPKTGSPGRTLRLHRLIAVAHKPSSDQHKP
jgi:ubiquinone/menaquinone biosynthesis C-methylase UbiE